MPRIKRGLCGGHIYHVLNRGNAKQKVFHSRQDYLAFLELVKQAKKRITVKIFSYCLMPNHFHFVLMPVYAQELSRFMQWLMTSHVRRYHRCHGSCGHIWQGRYKSFLIQDDNHLLTVVRYVEANPLRAGLVGSAVDWKWSSFGNPSRDGFIDKLLVEVPDNWADYINAPFKDNELVDLRKSVVRGTPFGTPEWQYNISKELKLESTLRPRGRPRRDGSNEKK